MADQKITELDALTAIDDADVLPVVDDPAGTPVTKKITAQNLIFGVGEYGSIYVDNGVTGQDVDSGTPEVLEAFNTAQGANGISSSGVTPAKASNKITVTDTGIYLVSLSMSFSGDGSVTWYTTIYWNGVSQAQLEIQRKLGVGGDTGACSTCGLVDVTTGSTDFEVYVEPDGAAKEIIVDHANLTVLKVGNT